MLDSVKLFFSFAKVSFLTQMEYRAAYFVRTLSKILDFGSGFALIAILLARFNAIGTWSTYEVLLLYALNILCYSLGATFTMPINNIGTSIRNGSIDSVLTKPVNPLYLYICQNVSAGYTSNYVISIGILVICLVNLDIKITTFRVIYLLLSIIGGALIHAAALIACGVPSFWLVKSRALSNIFYHEMTSFVDYPINIYSKVIQVILTFIMPYAFINYYPAQMFLSRADTPFHPMLAFLTPLVGIICFTLAYQFWKFGLKSYHSSGS